MYIVKKDEKIILVDEDLERLERTVAFMPDLADCTIEETDRDIDGFEFADTEEYKAKKENEARIARIAELKQMLADADYWTSKYSDGEYTEEEWAEKVAIRKEWRAEINELEQIKE